MPLLQLFPHKLSYEIVEQGTRDANDDYIQGDSHWSCPIECDAVAAPGAESYITLPDGGKRKYEYTVYMKPYVKDFQYNDKVKLFLYNGLVKEFTVKGFQRYQLQCKLWV